MIITCRYLNRDLSGHKKCLATEKDCVTISGNPFDCSLVDYDIWHLTHVMSLQEIVAREMRDYFQEVQKRRIQKNYKKSKGGS